MSTLLYHTGALGDFVTTIPAIHYYKRRNTGAPITLLGKPAIGMLAKDVGLIDDWLDIDNPKYLPLFHDTFSRGAGEFLSSFTTAILFTGPGSPIAENISKSGITRLFLQPPFPSIPVHVIDYHLSLFGDLETMVASDKVPAIVPSATSFASAETILPADKPRHVAIHPGSGSAKKNWPFDRFLYVAEYFRSKKIPVLWIKGPAEDGFGFPSHDMIVDNLPLPLLAALLYRCRRYIGNDSGVTHLAAAAGCPTITLWGPSDQIVWGTRGRKVSIVKKTDGTFQEIPWERIIERL